MRKRKQKPNKPMEYPLPATPKIKEIRMKLLNLWKDGKGHPMSIAQPLMKMYPKSAVLYTIGMCIRGGSLVKLPNGNGEMKPLFQLKSGQKKPQRKEGTFHRTPRK